jgi:hypothetical protein
MLTATLVALLLRGPILDAPVPAAAPIEHSQNGRRVDLYFKGDIPDPVRVFAPRGEEFFINGEKMSCLKQGGYRLLTFPILHNQEACEPKQ